MPRSKPHAAAERLQDRPPASTGAAPSRHGKSVQDRHRTAAIVRAFKAGDTLEIIGARYGITRQRVHQILVRMGIRRRGRTKVRPVAWLPREEL